MKFAIQTFLLRSICIQETTPVINQVWLEYRNLSPMKFRYTLVNNQKVPGPTNHVGFKNILRLMNLLDPICWHWNASSGHESNSTLNFWNDSIWNGTAIAFENWLKYKKTHFELFKLCGMICWDWKISSRRESSSMLQFYWKFEGIGIELETIKEIFLHIQNILTWSADTGTWVLDLDRVGDCSSHTNMWKAEEF